eukprot:4889213-Pleurochrysis_carterae.AAC.1
MRAGERAHALVRVRCAPVDFVRTTGGACSLLAPDSEVAPADELLPKSKACQGAYQEPACAESEQAALSCTHTR